MLLLNFVATNYKLLCDIETIFGFTCVMFMLETLQGLIEYVQNLYLQLCEQCEFVSSIPCVKGLECYKKNLPLILVVVLY
jgi:hypothetical protein